MRIREAFRRIVIAPVICGAMLVSNVFGVLDTPETHVPRYDNICNVMFIQNADCPEDTLGWAGSSEDDRVAKA